MSQESLMPVLLQAKQQASFMHIMTKAGQKLLGHIETVSALGAGGCEYFTFRTESLESGAVLFVAADAIDQLSVLQQGPLVAKPSQLGPANLGRDLIFEVATYIKSAEGVSPEVKLITKDGRCYFGCLGRFGRERFKITNRKHCSGPVEARLDTREVATIQVSPPRSRNSGLQAW